MYTDACSDITSLINQADLRKSAPNFKFGCMICNYLCQTRYQNLYN